MANSAYSLVNLNRAVQLNQATEARQYDPTVATMADGSFVIAYSNVTSIRMQRFTAGGTALGDEVVVSGGGTGLAPHLARLADGRLAVTWNGDVGTAVGADMRIYSASLQPLTAQTRVNPAGTLASIGTVTALSDGGFVVAYELQKSATDHDAYAQRYTAAGTPVGEPVVVDASTAYSTEITATGLSDGGYMVAFSNRADPASTSGSSLVRAVVNTDGSLRLVPTVTDAATSAGDRNAAPDLAALPDGTAALSYVDGLQITTLTVNPDGTLGGSRSVADNIPGNSRPGLSVSPTGYTLETSGIYVNSIYTVGLSLFEPNATQPVAGTGINTWDSTSAPSIAWLDESNAVQVYAVQRQNGHSMSGGYSGQTVVNLYQVERNTTGATTSETLWLDGLADRVTMGGGDDGVFAGDGNNTVNLGAGNDVAVGGSGPDALLGGDGVDWLYGMAGADYLYGGTDTDALVGGDGNDFLFGEDGDDYGFGDAGDDAISGGAGVDRLYGGTGNDTLDGGSETDALYGEDGSDRLFGGSGDDYLFGGADADILSGGSGNDLLSADAGNDVLVGETGNDWLIGGAGADVFQFQGLDSGIDTIVDFQPGFDSVLLIGTARTSAADALASLAQVGADTVLMTSSTSGLIFLNTQVSQFNGASFAVV